MASQAQKGGLPLSGVRVLDLGRMIAAPWATQLLGDLGAEVIKVERPGTGDDIRGYGPPFLKAEDGGDDNSPYHLAMNRNKKSITVDLGKPEGQALIKALAQVSDVFIENFKAGDLERYGLGYAAIAAVNPDIVYCSISGFGQDGPMANRPGLDSIFQAATGLMSITGDPDGPPTKIGTALCDVTAGMYSVVGILAALRHREVNGGGGQYLDMALMDTNIAALANRAQAYLCDGETPQRLGSGSPGNYPAGMFKCADGEIMLVAGNDAHFRKLAAVLGDPGKADDPRFTTRPARVRNAAELLPWMEAAMTKKPRAHWLAALQAEGVICGSINTIPEALADPQVQYRGMIVEAPHPRAGTVKLLANPIRFSKTPLTTVSRPPDVGQHTEEVLGGLLGLSDAEIDKLRGEGAI